MPLPTDKCERCGRTAWEHLKLMLPVTDLRDFAQPAQRRYTEDCDFFPPPVSPTPDVHQDAPEERSFTE